MIPLIQRGKPVFCVIFFLLAKLPENLNANSTIRLNTSSFHLCFYNVYGTRMLE